MIVSPYTTVDTPALLIDLDRIQANIGRMQKKADDNGVKLRPHTKTHKMPYFAKLQLAAGAAGITVAKVGEAEVMADAGVRDIFIATEVVGTAKVRRIRDLVERGVTMNVGVDCPAHVRELEEALAGGGRVAVRIEVEVGENRSGVLSLEQAMEIALAVSKCEHVALDGLFCHEGHTYRAESLDECRRLTVEAQQYVLNMAAGMRDAGFEFETISIGATPSMLVADILPGITEIRPGTYIFMDAAQGQVAGDFNLCAATVLATVTSLPTRERVVLDTGAKALTAQTRNGGICNTPGLGLVKNGGGVRLAGVYDEHGIILDEKLRGTLKLGDKIEIIPNHICPAVNLYDRAHIVRGGAVVEIVPVAARGRTQ